MPSQKSLIATPPSGVLRRLARLPIALYRLRLGKRANWYQNPRATPKITIQVERSHLNMCAATLPQAEGPRLLLDYRLKHTLVTRELSRMLTGANLAQASSEELERIVQEALPIVVLLPQAGDTSL